MSNYVSVFTTPWMLTGVVVLLVAALVSTWVIRRPLASTARHVGFFIFAMAAGSILLVTLFREAPQGWCTTCLVADWGWPRLLNGDLGTEGLLNVVLFVPAAFLAVLVWRAPLRTVALAALGSGVIELIQPMLGVGVNDLTDLATNIAGAMIGAAAGAAVMVVVDSITARRFLAGRVLGVVAALVVVAVITVGVPHWLATQRQAQAHAQLERLYAHTNLADYRKHADTDWLAQRLTFSADSGNPTEEGYSTAEVARTRHTWTIFGATRCVISEWTATGFTLTDDAGAACRAPFHA